MNEIMKEKLTICIQKGGQRDQAEAFAGKYSLTIDEKPGEQLTLLFDSKGISLIGYGLSYQGDFENMIHRISNGRLQHEMLARAAKSTEEKKTAIDATAGMGEDSLLIAACGYEVTMYEQNPVIAILLKDSIRRAKKNPILKNIVGRMHLVVGNSIELLSEQITDLNLIYLDPMFPESRKSGLTNKKLQLIQKMEPPCFEEEKLFEAAIKAAPAKIIVKRPSKSEYLAGKSPNYSLNGKAIRYDCYC